MLYLLGFSLNTLSLFGLVLAIGIVVDDAIVVVENVERNIEEGLGAAGGGAPGDARGVRADHRHRAGAVRGVRADGVPLGRHRPVLQAVRGDHRDLHGDLGDQLADPVAGAGGGPAVKAHGAPKDLPTRLIDRLFGWLFRPFNRFFQRSSNGYEATGRQNPGPARRGVRGLRAAAGRCRRDVQARCPAALFRRRTSCT